jgi:hypothetical protein
VARALRHAVVSRLARTLGLTASVTSLDITNYSFEAFVAFLFEHPVVPVPSPGTGEPEPWYWSMETTFDPLVVAGHYIHLFTQPQPALSQYSGPELEQGFWAIVSGNLNCSVAEIIWDTSVPLEIRESAIRSMYYLYRDFFASHPLETADNMWWDSLAYDWHCGNRLRSNGGEDHSMQEVMFEVLSKILDLPEAHTRYAALHGLGHLHHPATPQLVERWLGKHESLDPDLICYAQEAARFEVM